MAINKQKVLRNASKYIRDGRWDDAVVEYRKILDEDSEDCYILNQIGECYMKKGDTEKAVAEFDKAAEIYKKNGQNVKAIAVFRKILRSNPNMSEINSKLANLFAEQGLIREAIEQYKSVADIYSEKGEIAQVLDTYQHIVDLDPGNPKTRLRLAELYQKEGFTEKAIREFSRVAEHFIKNDEVEQGLEIYQQAVNVDAGNASARLGLINAYVDLNRYDDALSLLNQSLENFPDSIELLVNAGRINTGLKNYHEAQRAYEKVLRINPNDLEVRERLGIIFGLQGKVDKGAQLIDMVVKQRYKRQEFGFALKALKEFQNAVPDHLETMQKIAIIYQKLGQEEQEIKQLEAIADYYVRNDMTEEAFDLYDTLIQKNPTNPDYREVLDELTNKMSDQSNFFSDEPAASAPEPAAAPAAEPPSGSFSMEEMEESIISSNEDDLDLDEYEELASLGQSSETEAPADLTIPDTEPEDNEQAAVDEVVEEVNVYLRYNLYQKAIDLVEETLKSHPRNETLKRTLEKLKASEAAVPVEPEEEEAPEPAAAPAPPKKAKKADKRGMSEAPVESQFHSAETPEELENLFSDIRNSVKQSLRDEDFEAHYNMGIGYKEMGMLDEAIEEFQTSSQSESLAVNSYSMIAQCHMEKGNFKAAIKTFRDCLQNFELAPEASVAIYYELGHAYERVGKLRDALKLYNKVAKRKNGQFRDVQTRLKKLKKRLAAAEAE